MWTSSNTAAEAVSVDALEISIVVACLDADRTLNRCLAALESACTGVRAETILVHTSATPPAVVLDSVRAGRATDQGSSQGELRMLAAEGAELVPELWAKGLQVSRGGVVAFTTTHCIVGREWVRSLLIAIEEGATGAGGAIDLDPATGPVDWAIYLLRFSPVIPPVQSSEVTYIAGDNAAYSRAALERHSGLFEEGFWEVEFHRRLRPEGARLVLTSGAEVIFGRSYTLRTILRHRFLHGRRFGRHRVDCGFSTWRGLVAAPFVPIILATRSLVRAAGRKDLLLKGIFALPLLLLIAAAWSVGEASGVWAASRTSRDLAREA